MVNCFWWSSIVVVQAYEWNLIASLVRYQRKFRLEEMGVQRDRYKEQVEPIFKTLYIIGMTINGLFHLAKIICIVVWVNRGKGNNLNKLNYPTIIFFSWLWISFMLSSVNVILVTKSHFLSCFRTHKT